MKKIIAISFLSIIVFACSHKTTTTVTKTETATEKTSSTSISNAEYLAGKIIYEAKCGTCHKLKDPARGNMTQWSGWIDKMAPKAKLTDAETAQITKYISVNALN